METINELREIANTEMAWMEMAPRDFVRIADAIEREIAEKYMELPVDADGEPIHVGDKLRSACSETEYTALGFWFDFDCGIWQVMVSSKQAMSGNMLRHVKPDRVKELLEERDRVREEVCMGVWSDPDNLEEALRKVDDEYAAKIREAVSTDE